MTPKKLYTVVDAYTEDDHYTVMTHVEAVA